MDTRITTNLENNNTFPVISAGNSGIIGNDQIVDISTLGSCTLWAGFFENRSQNYNSKTSNGAGNVGINFSDDLFYFNFTTLVQAMNFHALDGVYVEEDMDIFIENQLIPTFAVTSNRAGNIAIVSGGSNDNSDIKSNQINYFTITSSSNAIEFGKLTSPRSQHFATSNAAGNRAVFGAGIFSNENGNYLLHDTIDYIDILNKSDALLFGNCSQLILSSATSNGNLNIALFYGNNLNQTNTMVSTFNIVTLSDAADFGSLSSQTLSGCGLTSNGSQNKAIVARTHMDTLDYFTMNTSSNSIGFGELASPFDIDGCTSNS